MSSNYEIIAESFNKDSKIQVIEIPEPKGRFHLLSSAARGLGRQISNLFNPVSFIEGRSRAFQESSPRTDAFIKRVSRTIDKDELDARIYLNRHPKRNNLSVKTQQRDEFRKSIKNTIGKYAREQQQQEKNVKQYERHIQDNLDSFTDDFLAGKCSRDKDVDGLYFDFYNKVDRELIFAYEDEEQKKEIQNGNAIMREISPKEYRKLKAEVIKQVREVAENEVGYIKDAILKNESALADAIIFGVDSTGILNKQDIYGNLNDKILEKPSAENVALCQHIKQGKAVIVHDEELKFRGEVLDGEYTSQELQRIRSKVEDIIDDLCENENPAYRSTVVGTIIDYEKNLLHMCLLDPRLNSRDREVILGIKAGKMNEITLKDRIGEFKGPKKIVLKLVQFNLNLFRHSWNFASRLSRHTIGILQTPFTITGFDWGDFGRIATNLVTGACYVAKPFVALATMATLIAFGVLGIAVGAIPYGVYRLMKSAPSKQYDRVISYQNIQRNILEEINNNESNNLFTFEEDDDKKLNNNILFPGDGSEELL